MVMRIRATAVLTAAALGCLTMALPASAQEAAPQTAVDPLAPLPPGADTPEAKAEFKGVPSQQVTQIINWVLASADNGGRPFIVIDKVAAQVFVFDSKGRFRGVTPALVGIKPGDDSAPGVGDRELSDIPPDDRTTPAGRFVAKYGFAYGKRKVLWVDYHTAISLHAVVTHNKKEHRLERLKSPTPEDNRITFGCINVPTTFYNKVVTPMFSKGTGIVYILPETKPLNEAFPAFNPLLANRAASPAA